MAIGDVYQVQSFASFLGQVNLNVLAFEHLASGDATQAQALAVANDIKEIHRVRQVNPLVYTRWRAVQVRGTGVDYTTKPCNRTGGRLFEGTYTGTTAGGEVTSNILPPQCAFVTTLRTGFIGRSRRGRFFAGGFPETDQESGQWTSAMITAMTTAWSTFMTKYNSVTGTDPTWRLCIWSNRIATGCRPAPGGGWDHDLTAHPENASAGVQSVVHRTTVYTQRRRVVGVGL